MHQVCEVNIRSRRSQDLETPVRKDGEDEVINLSALGDLMQCGEWEEVASRGDLVSALNPLVDEVRHDDLVFANLETTCLGEQGRIAKEPLVIAEAEALAQCLRILDVDLVNVANNHAFDCHLSGFRVVRRMLEAEGILFLGAGEDRRAAAKPLIVKRRGIRLGWLAYADASCRPSHWASDDGPGVNPFDIERALIDIAALKSRVDHVIVSLHWGIEYCHIPSPQQVTEARRLVDAGARLVIGHHVHVVQGVERHGDGVIAYNLGNVTTSDHHVGGRLAIHQTPRTRSSFVLRAALSRHRLEHVEMVPIRSVDGQLRVDDDVARRYLAKANRKLASGISERQWRATRFYEDLLLRTARKLHPKVIGSIRPKHFATFAKNIVGAVSGRGPSA